MASIDDAAPAWQALVLQALRLAVRLSLRVHPTSLAELKNLLGVAVYRELQARGYPHGAMCLLLDCSPGTVKNLGRLSRGLASIPQPHPLQRLRSRLRGEPVRAVDLAALLPAREGIDVGRAALALLVERGILEPIRHRGAPAWRVSEGWRDRPEADWEAPLARIDQRYQDAITLVEALSNGPLTHAQLRSSTAGAMPPDRFAEALAFLEQEGQVESPPDASSPLRLAGHTHRLIPEDQRSRLRVGLHHLLEKLGWSLEFMVADGDPGQFGQRTWIFDARPEELEAFLREHRAFVVEKLSALEARAREQGGARRCVMVTALSPIPNPEARPEREAHARAPAARKGQNSDPDRSHKPG